MEEKLEIMTFKGWLKANEAGTSTACVAVFSRPFLGMTKRGAWGEEDPFFRRKKKGDRI